MAKELDIGITLKNCLFEGTIAYPGTFKTPFFEDLRFLGRQIEPVYPSRTEAACRDTELLSAMFILALLVLLKLNVTHPLRSAN